MRKTNFTGVRQRWRQLGRLLKTKKQLAMQQATVVSDLKNQHAELRGNIANNPTPDASEDVGPAPTQQVPSLNPAGDDMDGDLCEEMNPPAAQRRGEFGAI